MHSPRTGRRLLGGAIATVLALTVGVGSLAAAPAGAAGAPPAAAAPGGLLPLVPGAVLAAAGPGGFLAYVPHGGDGASGKLRWTPYGGGPVRDTVYDVVDGIAETSGDTVVTSSDSGGTQARNLFTGTSFPTRPVDDGWDSFYAGLAGPDIFVSGNTRLWIEAKDGEPRAVQGLAEDATYRRVQPGDATHGLLAVSGADGTQRVGLIDLTDATLTYPFPAGARNPVVSGDRLAWVEDDTAAHTLRAVVRDRATGTDTTLPLPGTAAGAELKIGLLGDWVTYGTTAVRIGTGEQAVLLDRADASATLPDGSAQIVQGSGAGQGDGVFRVSLGADGRPSVTLLAHAGTATSALHDTDNDGLADPLGRDASGGLWRDSAGDGRGRVRVGGGWQIYDTVESVGDIAGPYGPAFLSDLVARDRDGVLWLYQGREDGGFAARVRIGGGWQAYTRVTGGSDLTGDGRPDLVAVDKSGLLWLYRGTGETDRPFAARTRIGGGWNAYDRLTAVGDLAGGPGGDLVARDKAGVLWLYLGKGDGTFTQRRKIGGGWQAYSGLVGAGDADHDGKADLFAYLPGTRTLYLYSGTGDPSRPFAARAVSDAQTGNAYNLLS